MYTHMYNYTNALLLPRFATSVCSELRAPNFEIMLIINHGHPLCIKMTFYGHKGATTQLLDINLGATCFNKFGICRKSRNWSIFVQ